MLIRFENPEAFFLLIPVLALIGVSLWQTGKNFSIRRLVLIFLSLSSCVIAISRPQLGHFQSSKRLASGNLFIAMDVSKSMLTEDVSSSRLAFMITFVDRLLSSLPGIRVAIFPFAQDGYLQVPLTDDFDSIRDVLASMSPSVTTNQGSDLSGSMSTLLDLIVRTRNSAGEDWASAQVLLLSDGESHRSLDKSVFDRFQSERVPVFTVGIGTADGGFIPVPGRFGYGQQNLRDSDGRTVRSKLETESLTQIARITGAEYFPARFEQVYELSRRLQQHMKLSRLQSSFKLDAEYFPHFLALGLFFFTLEFFRKRWEFVLRLVPVLVAFYSTTASAWPEAVEEKLVKAGKDRPYSAFNLGLEAMGENDFPTAAELFLESATSTEDSTLKKKALYNAGNMFLRGGDPVQALAVYQQAYDTNARADSFNQEANQKISENIVLAMEQEKQQQQQQQQQQGEGDEKKQQPEDPGGPQEFRAQFFDEQQKRRIYDLVSGEEQQVRERLQDKKARERGIHNPGKDW